MEPQWISVDNGNVLLLPARGDLGDEEQLRFLCGQLERREPPPVRGTVHAQGVLRNVETVVVLGDIVNQPVDVIVNAANSSFGHGAGIAKAISDAARPEFIANGERWLRDHGECPTGSAAFIRSGLWNNPRVVGIVNAVGPSTRSPGADTSLITAATEAAFRGLPADLDAPSIALPLISGGIFGYTPESSAQAVVKAVVERARSGWIGRVLLITNEKAKIGAFVQAATAQGLVGLPASAVPERYHATIRVSRETRDRLFGAMWGHSALISLADGTEVLKVALRFVGPDVCRLTTTAMRVDDEAYVSG